MKRVAFLLSFLLLGCVTSLWAHDFVATGKDGQKLYFKITDARRQCVEVTYQGSITSVLPSAYSGEVTIPAKVKHNNKVYQVTGISRKEGSGSERSMSGCLPLSRTGSIISIRCRWTAVLPFQEAMSSHSSRHSTAVSCSGLMSRCRI